MKCNIDIEGDWFAVIITVLLVVFSVWGAIDIVRRIINAVI